MKAKAKEVYNKSLAFSEPPEVHFSVGRDDTMILTDSSDLSQVTSHRVKRGNRSIATNRKLAIITMPLRTMPALRVSWAA